MMARGLSYFGADNLPTCICEPSLLEKIVDIKKEVVLVGVWHRWRNHDGVYEPTEMVFDPKLNLVDYLIAPADITSEQIKTAETIVHASSKCLQSPGLFVLVRVILLSTNNEILVNEIAPRAHNSGHQTIEGNLIRKSICNCVFFKNCATGIPKNKVFRPCTI